MNPYEVARLARNRGVNTTEFLTRYCDSNGMKLNRTEQGACVFLTPDGCGVHADRPLVCRLYPLGRRVGADGEETFREVAPHPETQGEYGTCGTVQDFLTKQGVQPYVDAVERYVGMVGRMAEAIHPIIRHNDDLRTDVNQVIDNVTQQQAQTAPHWLDMDRVVARFCQERNMSEPFDLAERMDIHIQAMKTWAETS